MYTTILFDLDGVVIDSISLQRMAFAESYHDVVGEGEPPIDNYLSHSGDSFPNIMDKMGLPREMWQPYREFSTQYMNLIEIVPKMSDVLEELVERKVRLGLVTGKESGRTAQVLNDFNLARYFPVVVCSDMVTHAKPHPESVHRALRELQADPTQTAFIGDSENDILAAKSAGITALGVTWGVGKREGLVCAGADGIVENPREIIDFLTKNDPQNQSQILGRSQNVTEKKNGVDVIPHSYSNILSGPSQESIRQKCRHPRGSFLEFDKGEEHSSIPARFEKQVERYPEKLALHTKNARFTYKTLNQSANQLAHCLLQELGNENTSVALLFEQGEQQIISLLGVLKAGKIYAPIDPAYPHDRKAFMLEDSQATGIITDNKHFELATMLAPNLPIFNIDSLASSLPTQNPHSTVGPDSYAYILYTSGSTGKPKGVVENHRNVLHFTRNFTNPYGLCPEDNVLFPGSLCFSGSAEPLFMALLNGATLFPFDLRNEGVSKLGAWLESEKITIYSGATVFRQLMEGMTRQNPFPDIRLILLGGDTVFTSEVDLFKKFFSDDCILINGYGATEMKQLCRLYVSKDTEISGLHVPVGKSLEDIEVFLVDDDEQRIESGQVGEIAVQTRYIAPCYWGLPDLTRERFVAAPEGNGQRIYLTGDMGRMDEDGCFIHLGRKDFQVKIRGYRIEVREIETALLAIDVVKEAVVTAREEAGEKRLIAYVVPNGPSEINSSMLRAQLVESLPDYMIPSIFCMLDSLPRTLSNKIDRLSLPEPSLVRPALETLYVAPRNWAEELLVEIWEEVLELDRVGVDDVFLELGGDSLRAMKIIARTRDEFEIDVPISLLFKAPTIAAMAQVICDSAVSSSPEM